MKIGWFWLRGKKHRLANAKSVSHQELQNEKWIIFERGSSIRRATDSFFKKNKLEPEKSLESNDTYFVKLMIEKGVGVSLLPAWAVSNEVKSGKLTRVNIESDELKRSVSMVSLKGLQPAPTRQFISYIMSQKDKLGLLAKAE